MNQQVAAVRRRRQRPTPEQIENKLFSLLSDHTVGGDSVPISWASRRLNGEHGVDPDLWARFTNDAFEIAFSYVGEDRCSLMIRRPMLNQFVRWYLWQTLVCEWGGIRRWLWYRLLSRRVRRESVRWTGPF